MTGMTWGGALTVAAVIIVLFLLYKFMTSQKVDPATGNIKTIFTPFSGK